MPQSASLASAAVKTPHGHGQSAPVASARPMKRSFGAARLDHCNTARKNDSSLPPRDILSTATLCAGSRSPLLSLVHGRQKRGPRWRRRRRANVSPRSQVSLRPPRKKSGMRAAQPKQVEAAQRLIKRREFPPVSSAEKLPGSSSRMVSLSIRRTLRPPQPRARQTTPATRILRPPTGSKARSTGRGPPRDIRRLWARGLGSDPLGAEERLGLRRGG